MSQPMKLEVNCAAWGSIAYYRDADDCTEKAAAALAVGNDELAADLTLRATALRAAGDNGLAAAGLPQGTRPVRVVELTAQEQEQRTRDAAAAGEDALRLLRSRRDATLAQTDWTQLPDAPLEPSEKAAWDEYRQALRDLPATADPFNPEWPSPPSRR